MLVLFDFICFQFFFSLSVFIAVEYLCLPLVYSYSHIKECGSNHVVSKYNVGYL